jgi:SAM-dependent methyltransferase
MRIGSIPENPLEHILLRLGLVPTPVVDTFQAIVRARAIMVATKLGIFEALRDGPKTSLEVAERVKTNPRATEKLLRSLVGAGYLRYKGSRYDLVRAVCKWLLRDSPSSLYDYTLHRFLEWEVAGSFEDFVRTGQHLRVHENMSAEQWGMYQRGMRSLASLSGSEVARRIQLPAKATALLDLGGSHGFYSVCICRRHPQLLATIIDLPEAVQFAGPILAKEKMGDRVVHRPGDALTTDLGAKAWDVILIFQLMHHFDEPTNIKLMQRIAEALRPGGVVAVLEILRPDSPNSTGQTGALLDLFFAVTSLSGCWSLEEIAAWQRKAKLTPRKPIRLLTIPGAAIVAAVKAR